MLLMKLLVSGSISWTSFNGKIFVFKNDQKICLFFMSVFNPESDFIYVIAMYHINCIVAQTSPNTMA